MTRNRSNVPWPVTPADSGSRTRWISEQQRIYRLAAARKYRPVRQSTAATATSR